MAPTSDRVAELMLLLFPHGGQRGARRNAQAALAATQAQAEARREAIATLRSLGQLSPGQPQALEVHQS
jgi:hypothetical protein